MSALDITPERQHAVLSAMRGFSTTEILDVLSNVMANTLNQLHGQEAPAHYIEQADEVMLKLVQCKNMLDASNRLNRTVHDARVRIKVRYERSEELKRQKAERTHV